MTILYVLLALALFGVLVVLHELGHFIMARLFGVTIHEFSIGMGPKLFSKKGKKHDTAYSVRAFPLAVTSVWRVRTRKPTIPTLFIKSPFGSAC